MKKLNTLLKSEKAQATIVVGGVFLLTGLITLLALYLDK
jgi:hypothetical protein